MPDERDSKATAEALRLKRERESKAEELKDERVEKAADLKEERIDKARALAYQRGRDDERIEARFEDVEGRLDAISSSQSLTAERLHGLEGSVAEIITLAKEATRRAGNQVSTRQFLVGAGGLGVGIITLVIANV